MAADVKSVYDQWQAKKKAYAAYQESYSQKRLQLDNEGNELASAYQSASERIDEMTEEGQSLLKRLSLQFGQGAVWNPYTVVLANHQERLRKAYQSDLRDWEERSEELTAAYHKDCDRYEKAIAKLREAYLNGE
ncbi:hypothetical protein DDV21_003685 [Streptococcus chenjunshii]|uniref:DUF5082 domain-containing protein n=1 Tax=Streptococcus chenjunshii TaxID=2173853 RepID=A0A346NA29_9STRE|nr:hypothetical protein [Streptococcus chenjunshii]AXQ77874.1 hypothetical protein DDV21_001700 [Streptococcus chenjunshii]AXQ78241.1 hypothetical protein DDV21_003685 [Streptococcus chenjunshii]RFU49969.1 hypothetical protein DDV22_11135 [Streptococcus chenjunshii]RFU52165.1 hypothetical protein DDV23_11130 [Streptococcus chenjunshii]